jgi:hypothetical protein
VAPNRADLNSEAIKSFSQRQTLMSPPGRTGTVDNQAESGQQQTCSHGAESGRSTPLLPVAYPETAIRSFAGGSGAQWKAPLDGGATPNVRSALRLRCFAAVSTTPRYHGRNRLGCRTENTEW